MLFKYGDQAYTFYIILQGEVSVSIPQDITVTMRICDYNKFVEENKNIILSQNEKNFVHIAESINSEQHRVKAGKSFRFVSAVEIEKSF